MTQPASDLYDRLPDEMKWARQWCVAGPDKAPYSVGSNGLYRASVTNPTQWLDFETAVEAAIQYGGGIGYVLASNDQLTCIDMDVTDAQTQTEKGEPIDESKWTTVDSFNRYNAIVTAFDSYTERSRSGKGIHVWVRGKIGKGCRRDGVEVYSQERFIICTGNIILDKPIKENTELLTILVNEISGGQFVQTDLVELAETESDATVWERAKNAVNNHNFIPLCNGEWQAKGYPSQSEADLALMSMFCFYSKSNAQCRRMFRQTGLGQREKATRDDKYINYTLKQIRSRQAREDASLEKGSVIADAIVKNEEAKYAQQVGPQDGAVIDTQSLINKMQQHSYEQSVRASTVPQPAPAVVTMAQLAPMPQVEDSGLQWPPGFAGAIAGFIYQSAPRPVKEVAIVAALGLLAGICGKTFSIPQSGLNLYIILVARSAIGKEAMHSGISSLMEAVRSRCAMSMQFIDFSDFASGPALAKAVAMNPSFVNIAGEWGHKLKRLASDSRLDGPMQQLRTVMTNLYQKSGPSAIVGGITYSKKEENVASISGVAYSMIGETTPGTLYESLTESMMEDGFLSRFTMIEYTGERPAHNYGAITEPDGALAEAIAQLCSHSNDLLRANRRQAVGRDEAAAQLMLAFDKECDIEINKTTDEAHRQMWNRAALKVMRISALLAVGDNYMHPVVQAHHVEWALDVVRRDIAVMGRRMADGDIGVNDTSRERKLLMLAREYIREPVPSGYNVPDTMRQAGIIPRKYFQIRASRLTSFSNHRLGSSNALDATLRALCDGGYLMEVNRDKMMEKFSFHGKSYQVLDLDFGGKKS